MFWDAIKEVISRISFDAIYCIPAVNHSFFLFKGVNEIIKGFKYPDVL